MAFVRSSKKGIGKLIDLRQSKQYVKEVETLINAEFLKAKNQFIRNFNNHPVTKEIEAGGGATNISGTLSGEGNLFSYIGFPKNSKPIMPIRALFSEIFMNKVLVKKDGSVDTIIAYPKAEDYFAVTPLPWASGRSWAKGIETGISGFGFFLNESNRKSRSGVGIQVGGKIRAGEFKTRDYITKLIKDFEITIINLNRTTIR